MGNTNETQKQKPNETPLQQQGRPQKSLKEEIVSDDTLDVDRKWTPLPPPIEGTEVYDVSHKRVKSLPSLDPCSKTLRKLLAFRCGIHSGSELHAELAKLSSLTSLDLSYNLLNVTKDLIPILSTVITSNSLSELYLRSFSVSGFTPVPIPETVRLDKWSQTLQVLDLGGCMINFLPSSICSLVNLKKLLLDHNMLEQLPNDIGNLSHLEHLDLSFNSLLELPRSIGNLKSLTFIDVGRNKLTSLPDEFIGLKNNLQTLKLFPSNIVDIPNVIFELKSLKYLDFSGTPTTKINGNDFEKLSSALTTLHLRWNKLSELPQSVFSKLDALTLLDLSGNEQLKSIPLLPISCSVLNISYTQIPAESIPLTVTTLLTENGYFRYNHQLPQNEQEDCNSLPTNWSFPNHPIQGSTLSPETLLDKFLGTIFGGAIGDSIGLELKELHINPKHVPLGFTTENNFSNFNELQIHSQEIAIKQACAEYGIGPLNHGMFLRDKHRSRWDIGDWTDDTDQAILLIRNMVKNNGVINAKEVALSIFNWALEGFSELGDTAGLGIGSNVSAVLRHPDFKTDPQKASKSVWEERGKTVAPNGAVMRTAVIGLIGIKNPSIVVQNTLEACTVTHFDPRCRTSCVAVTTAISLMLSGEQNTETIIETSIKTALQSLSSNEDPQQIEKEFREYMSKKRFVDADFDEGSAIGYTFKTLAAGFIALRMNDFTQAISELSFQAGDADTNAAVAGALLGCKIGFKSLPKHWLNGLLHKNWLMNEAEQLWKILTSN